MKKYIIAFIFINLIFFAMSVSANDRLLFILDFSNSMNDPLKGQKKVNLMLDTMSEVLPTLDKDDYVGLRVYGYRGGFSAYDMCKASRLMVPISPASGANIQSELFNLKARGMTPITYSLKQAVNNDFGEFKGTKHIILLSDGGENCDESPCDYIMELIKTRKDVKIDAIAFSIKNQDDIDQLKCTSLVTGGKFYSANTAAQLKDSLNKSTISKKEVDAVILQ